MQMKYLIKCKGTLKFQLKNSKTGSTLVLAHVPRTIIITSPYLRGHKRDKVTFLRGLWLVSTGHKPPLLPRKTSHDE